MIITVGMIDIADNIKEALANTRVHPVTGESLPAGGASFTITIPEFISDFNREEGIIMNNILLHFLGKAWFCPKGSCVNCPEPKGSRLVTHPSGPNVTG